MAFCTYCGNEISPLAGACPSCGHPTAGGAGVIVAEPVLAQWWQRVAAHLIDGAVMLVPFGIAYLIVVAPMVAIDERTGTVGLDVGFQEKVLQLSLVFAAIGGLYKFLMEGWRGQTVGKMAMRLFVRTVDGEHISYGQAFARWLFFTVGWWFLIPGVLDSLWPLWDARKQALHDKVARTIVVHAP